MNDPAAQEPNWISRNWRWFVPVAIVSSLVVTGALMLGAMTLLLGKIKAMEPYPQTLALVRGDPDIQTALGLPIEDGWMFSGNIETQGARGSATLAIPVQGPRGEATIFADASMEAGVWTYTLIIVDIAGQRRIDLLESGSVTH